MKERSLRDLFHLVKQVLPEEQELISVTPETTVSMALAEMSAKNLSQLPVVEGKEVLGVFSYRSFAEGMRKLAAKERDALSLPVEEFTEDLKFATIRDELTALLDEFDLKDAVLVGSEDRLQGIITTVDALRYFYKVASPYVLLREIELAIRGLIRASVSPEDLRECIDVTLTHLYVQNNQKVPCSLEEMSFNDYVGLLRYKGTWEKFRQAFGGTANTVYAKLQPLPELRNDVFHFRRELTVEEYEVLRETRDWLLKRIRKVEGGKRGSSDE